MACCAATEMCYLWAAVSSTGEALSLAAGEMCLL